MKVGGGETAISRLPHGEIGALRNGERKTMCRYSTETLAQYLLGSIKERKAERIKSHLAACSECRAVFDRLRSVASDLARIDGPEELNAPENLIRQTVNSVCALRERRDAGPGLLNRIIAAAIPLPAASGIRSTWAGPLEDIRQYRYATHDGAELAVSLIREPDAITNTVVVDIFAVGEKQAAVFPGRCVLCSTFGEKEQPIPETGQVIFDSVEAGLYEIDLELSDRVITVPDLTV